MDRKSLWEVYDDSQLQELEKLSADYRMFLDKGKTERECIRETVKMAKEAGYRDLKEIL